MRDWTHMVYKAMRVVLGKKYNFTNRFGKESNTTDPEWLIWHTCFSFAIREIAARMVKSQQPKAHSYVLKGPLGMNGEPTSVPLLVAPKDAPPISPTPAFTNDPDIEISISSIPT